MYKILIICPHFPSLDYYSSLSDDPRSKFLYEYAIEWSKQGHDITIVHTPPKYSRLLTGFIHIANYLFKGKYNRFKQNTDAISDNCYIVDGINVIRSPIVKSIPHVQLTKSAIIKTITNINKKNNIDFLSFDFVFLDYLSPSLDIASQLRFSNNCRVTPILHVTDKNYFRKFRTFYSKLLTSNCSSILCRNVGLKNFFQQELSSDMKFSMMYSGVPNDLSISTPKKGKVRKFLFVGRLIESKNVQELLRAFSLLKLTYDFTFEIVGDGYYRAELEKLSIKYGLSDYVTFLGAVERKSVFEKMADCDSLLMVTEETFGMVYVEAMSQGCIVVAAKDQGIDGVVVDGKNGFLVEMNNHDQLVNAIFNIASLPVEQSEEISRRAIDTAINMRNYSLSEKLLENIRV